MISLDAIQEFEDNFRKTIGGSASMLQFGLSSIMGVSKALVESGDLTQLEYNKLKIDTQKCFNMAQSGRIVESETFAKKIELWMQERVTENRKIKAEKEKKQAEKDAQDLKDQEDKNKQDVD